MPKKQTDERWMEGRDRPVRVYLTEGEHALVRRAAALVDKSVSRFAVESIVLVASEVTTVKLVVSPETTPADQAEAKPAKAKVKKKGTRKRKDG